MLTERVCSDGLMRKEILPVRFATRLAHSLWCSQSISLMPTMPENQPALTLHQMGRIFYGMSLQLYMYHFDIDSVRSLHTKIMFAESSSRPESWWLMAGYFMVCSHISLGMLHLLRLSMLKLPLTSGRRCFSLWSPMFDLLGLEFFSRTRQPGYHTGWHPDWLFAMNGSGWGISGTPFDLHDPRLLAMAAAQRHFLEAEYDEYAARNASGASFCRSAALIVSLWSHWPCNLFFLQYSCSDLFWTLHRPAIRLKGVRHDYMEINNLILRVLPYACSWWLSFYWGTHCPSTILKEKMMPPRFSLYVPKFYSVKILFFFVITVGHLRSECCFFIARN